MQRTFQVHSNNSLVLGAKSNNSLPYPYPREGVGYKVVRQTPKLLDHHLPWIYYRETDVLTDYVESSCEHYKHHKTPNTDT